MIFESSLDPIKLPNDDLTSVVLSRAAELGDKPALIDGASGRSLTYNELQAHIRRFAVGLQKRGFGKGDVMAIFCPNIPEYAVAFLGVAAVGGINSTANSLYAADELIHQFKDAGARFLLTIPQFLDRALPAAKASGIEEVFVLGEAEGCTPYSALLAEDGEMPKVEINPAKDLVALPYSSGTTGLSKGVMLTHHNLVANMVLSCEMNNLSEEDNIVGVLPFFHIYGMTLIMCLGIYRGATLVTMTRFELEPFLKIIQQYKITGMNLVPPLVLALAKHPVVDNYDLSSVRIISSGAAPLGKELAQACGTRVGCQIYQGYGLTEVAGASHILPVEDPRSEGKAGSVGPVLPNTRSKVVDIESGAELGPNEKGEVCIQGPHVMTGYLNNKEATDDCLDAEGWLRTGDIGYADDDGYFFIVDRMKELIKYKGYQVAPAELEALLVSHEAIADAAVIPSPDEEAGEVPKAFVVLKADISADEIMKFVADNVAPHKKIRRLQVVDEIPKSAAGKILRRVLVEQERAGGES
ncbi:MAG: 4-coumarate--CoA ligase family protein [Pseudohongiellaceae bacterium]